MPVSPGCRHRCFVNCGFEESWTHLEDLLCLDEWLAKESVSLSDALFEVVGNLTEPQIKPRVVALRRAVHQVRAPGKGAWNSQVIAALPPAIADRVRRWHSRLRERDLGRAELSRLLADEVIRKQASLRRIVADESFQHALSQASSALSEEVSKWLADDQRHMKRRTLVGLARFLARASAKTSPYSTFTTSAVGRWTRHGAAIRFAGDLDVQGVVEVSRRVVQQLVEAFVVRPSLSAYVPLRVNPSTQITGDTVSFLGPRPEESINTLPTSLALRECLRVVGCDTGHTHDELRALLAQETGEDPARLGPFLDRLVEIGLLEHRSPVADQSERPLDELLAWLESSIHSSTDPGLAEVIVLLESLRTQLRHPFDLDDVEGCRARQDAVAHTVRALSISLDLPLPEIDQLRGVVVRENSFFRSARLECALPQWQPALDDLDIVRRWLAVYDRFLPMRLALVHYVSRRFGDASVPFLTLHRAIQEDLSLPEELCEEWLATLRPLLRMNSPGSPVFFDDSRIPRLCELPRLWRESATVLWSLEDDDGVIRADPDVIANLSAGWPPWVRPPGSIACHLQPHLVDGELRLILNSMSGGYGRGRSRWLRLASQAGIGVVAEHVSRSGSTEPVVAELSGTFGMSINLRVPMAPFEIDYSFTTSDRSASERVPLSDLIVRHDHRTDQLRLFSRQLGLQVQPVYLGLMAEALLPQAARLLLAAFGPSTLMPSGTPLVWRPEDAEPRCLPRVEVGRVTLQRARWLVPVGEVPARWSGESDADYLMRLISWLRASGIPERCYVRVLDPEAEWQSQAFAKFRRPQFVDFANFFLVMAFEHMLKGHTGRHDLPIEGGNPNGLLSFEEALPQPEEGCGPDPAEPRVTEFIVELTASEA